MSIELVMPSNHLILSPPFPLAFNLIQHQGLFQWVGSSHQIAKVLELQLQCQSFQWIFRTDFLSDWLVWFLFSPRESQESSPTPQLKSINSSVLNLLYGPTLTSIHDYWKTIALTRQTFVGKVMSLLFNMLFRFVIAFLSRSKHLLILCLQSPYSVILEPKKIKSVTAVLCLVTQLCQTLCNPMDCSLPGFFLHGDSPGKNTGYGLPCPLPGDLPNPGIKPRSLVLQAGSLPSEPSGKP